MELVVPHGIEPGVLGRAGHGRKRIDGLVQTGHRDAKLGHGTSSDYAYRQHPTMIFERWRLFRIGCLRLGATTIRHSDKIIDRIRVDGDLARHVDSHAVASLVAVSADSAVGSPKGHHSSKEERHEQL